MASPGSRKVDVSDPSLVEPTTADLTGTWRVTTIGGAPPIEGIAPAIELAPGGALYATAGLNRIAGSYEVVDGELHSSPLATTLFANRFARSLGAYSYSIYLLHGPVLWAMDRSGIFATTGPALGFALGLATVYAVGWLGFRIVEMPAQALLRRPLAGWLQPRFEALVPGVPARR